MKAVITGYSSKIGQVVKSCFPNFEWVDISRRTGIDLTTEQGLNDLEKISQGSDIFFNIAYVGPYQGTILKKIFNLYLEEKSKVSKRIINFGSLATTVDSQFRKDQPNYISGKLYLEKIHNECCNFFEHNCFLDHAIPQSILLRFGFMLTEENRIGQSPFTDETQLIEIVRYVVNSKSHLSNIDVR